MDEHTDDACAAPGCDRTEGRRKRGLCTRCYQRAKARRQLALYPSSMVPRGATLAERLEHHGWNVTPAGCWEWVGSLNQNGYGQLAVGTDRPEIASRVAYTAWVGPIPAEGVVCHECDNPPCINPAHLFIGTRADNNRDAADKARTANGELRPHKLKDAQVTEIRRRYLRGDVKQRTLALEFGVSQQLISSLVRLERRPKPTHPRRDA